MISSPLQWAEVQGYPGFPLAHGLENGNPAPPLSLVPALLTEQMPEVAARGPATSLGLHGKIYCSDPLICPLLLAKNHRLFCTSPPRLWLAEPRTSPSWLPWSSFRFPPHLPLLHPAPPNEPGKHSASSLLLFKSEPSRSTSEKQMFKERTFKISHSNTWAGRVWNSVPRRSPSTCDKPLFAAVRAVSKEKGWSNTIEQKLFKKKARSTECVATRETL